MSHNDIEGTLLTRKAKISIKVGTTYHELDSLQDITINTGMEYEYAKSTAGKIKALPILQISDFLFTVQRTDDFYDITGNDKKTISYFQSQLGKIPPEPLDITFKFLSMSGVQQNNQVEVEHTGVVETITENWNQDLGGEVLTVSGRIITPGKGVRS